VVFTQRLAGCKNCKSRNSSWRVVGKPSNWLAGFTAWCQLLSEANSCRLIPYTSGVDAAATLWCALGIVEFDHHWTSYRSIAVDEVDDVLGDFVLRGLKSRFQPHQTPAEIIHDGHLGRPPVFSCNEAYGKDLHTVVDVVLGRLCCSFASRIREAEYKSVFKGQSRRLLEFHYAPG
jgi:hypothetical protein